MQFALNLICSYQIKLSQTSYKIFKSEKATAIAQGTHETKIESGFA
jgi:hypothetical protein